MNARKWSAKWRNCNIYDILFFDFNRGAKAVVAARNICTIYGDSVIGASMAQKWFSRFNEDRFDITDTQRSGRHLGFDEHCLNTLIHKYSW